MINFKEITQAIEEILTEHTNGYMIERNAERNIDPNVASKEKGWINILKSTIDYEAYTIGATPWKANIECKIEIQYADEQDYRTEDGLEDAVAEIMGILNDHKTLDGEVLMTTGYRVEYAINEGVRPYHQAAIITIKAEART
jgi:hypothetical protein